jgi:hypothetical protein
MQRNNRSRGEVARVPIAYLILGYENNRNTIIDFHRKAKTMIGWVTDPIYTMVDSKIDWAFKEISAAIGKGVKCRKITEITMDNLSQCKEVMPKLNEMRHLEGVRGAFAVSDQEFIAMVPSLEEARDDYVKFIYSDAESMVTHKQLIFDVLWDKATSAQSRISELEEKTSLASKGERRGSSSSSTFSTTEEKPRRNLIDRIYACRDCRETFLYAWEVDEHRKTTGHEHYWDSPII